MSRESWDAYFMRLARQAATRSTCDRRHVGAVIVREHFILATGYNGSLPGAPHCTDVGHDMHDGHCVRTVHAEANAICQAARNGVRTDGATAFVTASPCLSCLKLLVSAGVRRVVWADDYCDARTHAYAQDVGVVLERVSE